MKKLFMILVLTVHLSLFAKGNTETAGDLLAAAIPAAGYMTALSFHDSEGQHQFYKTYGATLVATYILKYSVRAKRPLGNSRTSFPSGHTSSAFAGATFIHRRYGLRYALVPYLGAIYTAYSRVHAHKHYTRDVIAGSILGAAFGYYFVTSYKNFTLMPVAGYDFAGVQFAWKW